MKRRLISTGLLAIQLVAMVGLGVCITNLWFQYHPEQRTTVEVIERTYRLKGDVNQDGRTNDADTQIVNANMGKANPDYSDGDLNEDGKIDNEDLAIVLKHQGNGKPEFRLI